VIAVEGGFGTLSEIALALNMGIPVVGLNTWELERGEEEAKEIIRVRTPQEAVRRAMEAAHGR
ncbi:TIGR00725 family protein, partial [bacterium]|nr:TIGR00725 family protein [bacterium]